MKPIPKGMPIDGLISFCQKHNIRKMWLYGSILGKHFRKNSDVDILVDFEKGKQPGWSFFVLHEELEPLFKRKVDLYTPQDFRPSRRKEILAEAKLVYEK